MRDAHQAIIAAVAIWRVKRIPAENEPFAGEFRAQFTLSRLSHSLAPCADDVHIIRNRDLTVCSRRRSQL